MSKSDQIARGHSLRITRIDAGVTQIALADHFNVTRQQVQKWETGKRPLLQAPYNVMIEWLAEQKTSKQRIRAPHTTAVADHHAVLDYLRRP